MAAHPGGVAVGEQPRLLPPGPGLAGGPGGGRGLRLAGLAPRRHALRGRVRGRTGGGRRQPARGQAAAFPFTLGDKREAFERIVEWMSPDFQHQPGRFALMFLVLALLLLVRARLSWRDVVPVVAFIAAGLLAMRNMPIAAVVLAPVLGRVLKRPDSLPALPPPPASRQRINRVFAVDHRRRFRHLRAHGEVQRPSRPIGLPDRGHRLPGGVRPAGRAPPRRPPGLRRQLLRAPVRAEGEGLHRRPLRHVPGDGAPRLPAAAGRGPPVAGHPPGPPDRRRPLGQGPAPDRRCSRRAGSGWRSTPRATGSSSAAYDIRIR